MSDQKQQKRERKHILDLEKYVDKKLRVKFSGGREVVGVLQGYDPLSNLVLSDTIEFLRDPSDLSKITDKTRTLGLCVCRHVSIVMIAPEEGMTETENPFAVPDTDES
ncbi:hypothetical protein PTSG_06970 [Salpingoeca rosetta]|uniref:Sm domain-containing protein n=1 Tax=Salpingoeca rosetta (strain ATCC 50818 / BSB-021) TaxID=946362 RepID=F2UFC0_SALR5|nr:uncharacterized protein PTSG_06970 [Salpingoeca rosetta]EGD75320.1 hypothetical protein PTSG_06970 [Salpingoeca rosetta]|eukprot:XP_004992373.1 hypothetical protein PTSG_06970 [Salpingoeca rosetta]